MLEKISKLIYRPDLSLQENLKISEGIMIGIFGGIENTKNVFLEIMPLIDSFTEEDIISLMNLVNKLKENKSFFDLIRFAANPDEELIEITPVLAKLFEILYSHLRNRIPLTGSDAEHVLIPGLLGKFVHAKKIFSVKEITDEFGVTKRTFLKWLQWFFGDKFNARKKITLIEYIEIHAAMLIYDKKRKFNFAQDANLYFEQLLKGFVFKKSDLAELIGTDLKTLTNNLAKKYPHYPHIDKFPWSIAKEFKEKLG